VSSEQALARRHDGATVTEGCRAEFEYREQGREL
jgi:hypothetical protein